MNEVKGRREALEGTLCWLSGGPKGNPENVQLRPLHGAGDGLLQGYFKSSIYLNIYALGMPSCCSSPKWGSVEGNASMGLEIKNNNTQNMREGIGRPSLPVSNQQQMTLFFLDGR